ncbi:CDP-alcohol phosphatidyltransferase family protein [Actinomadura sp. HBU206391]|uniref:CDP-alcohol phosphatidyltransferase family protein n=1 Tax=Actinomadura sp. HBU206391 TaxID=2731692 RepID=UPI0016500DBA|nr:CDP-alcohol phosphatidyltransferase family protein [Actinomadura sp. HBU206391]MBC6458144.1 CDP-alcohol phosphatidyltransferase family protein [Actinomadura sp. HBU206391]
MALAVVVATEPVEGAAAGGPASTAELRYGDTDQVLLRRLLDQLASLNVHDAHVIARPATVAALRHPGESGEPGYDAPGYDVIESADVAMDLREIARLAGAAREPVLVLHGDLVMSNEQLARVVHDTKPGALALVAGRRPEQEPFRPVVRTKGGLVVSAGSRHHQVTDPDAEFRGVLRVGSKLAGELAAAAKNLADLVGTLPDSEPVRALGQAPQEVDRFVDNEAVAVERALRTRAVAGSAAAGLGGTPPRGDDAPALLLVGLVRSGVRVAARPVRDLVCDRVLTAGQVPAARAAVDAVDEDRVRLNDAVKGNDGFFTTYAVSTYSRYIAKWAARRQLTPNMVTSMSMAVAVVAAVWFSAGTRLGLVLGGLLLYFAFVLDCVDGQLARYTRQFSTLGAWLDATFDRAKEYVVYVGLAMGSTAAAAGTLAHGGDVWGLAVAALILQTVRHMIDFSFEAARVRGPAAPLPEVPLTDRDDSMLDPPPSAPGTARRPGGLGHLAMWLSARTERIGGLRWAKKIVILPIGERFALIAITAALFNAKVTFLSLLIWGSLATAYTLTGRVLRSLAR